jgi:hypothetical protein
MTIIRIALSLIVIAAAMFSVVTVSKIVAVGGPAYRWEFWLPLFLLMFGGFMLGFWCGRISNA